VRLTKELQMPKPISTPTALKSFMDKHKLTQADIARIVKLKPSKAKDTPNHHRAVHEWLNGTRQPVMGWECVNMYIQKYLDK